MVVIWSVSEYLFRFDIEYSILFCDNIKKEDQLWPSLCALFEDR